MAGSQAVELWAAALVDAAGVFVQNKGFASITHPAPGAYVLLFDASFQPDPVRALVSISARAVVARFITYDMTTTTQIKITTFDNLGAPADVPFSVRVEQLTG